jgi:hypothetical protein
MGLTWAIGWALVGFGIELVHNVWPNPLGSLVDIWPAALAYPAFFGGLAFSAVLGIAARRRRFDELSLPLFAAWGGLGGLLLGLLPAGLAATGAASIAEAASFVGFVTLLSAASASGSLMLARAASDRELADVDAEVAEVGLTDDEARKLLGRNGSPRS